MIVLGINGEISMQYENIFHINYNFNHDATVVMVEDGKIVYAMEEERLNRIKHTNKAPVEALKFCLNKRNIGLKNVDAIAIYGDEEIYNMALHGVYRVEEEKTIRYYVHRYLKTATGQDIPDEKIFFIPHHQAHAYSAYAVSGFTDSLVMSIDGEGDNISGQLYQVRNGKWELLQALQTEKSLGTFYNQFIEYLGYQQFDEYKVMGLAPYGDPQKYGPLFKSFYRLLPEGKYELKLVPFVYIYSIFSNYFKPRRKGEKFTQEHKDFAAGLQEALEDILMHVVTYYQQCTKQKYLCLAGGVAHNCSITGKLLYKNIFEDIFVQPAAHDAGCALGAALRVYSEKNKNVKYDVMKDVYLGSDIGDDTEIYQKLSCWKEFINVRKIDDIEKETAKLLANGQVIGWVQGRAEYGPRALGNRSILADPRPEENKDIINAMIKKREGYRPFAPSVLEEYVDKFFVLPNSKRDFPFMNFVLKVKDEPAKELRAITHVDNTARVQTVSKATNERYWNLIHEFGKLTNIPILLNTSFNNNVEPIVNSVDDAVVCFLTTKINSLVIGHYMIEKKQDIISKLLNTKIVLPLHTKILADRSYKSFTELKDTYILSNTFNRQYDIEITPSMYQLLQNVDNQNTLISIIHKLGIESEEAIGELTNEIYELWSSRRVILYPEG